MQRSVVFYGKSFIYEYERKRVKNINLRIRSDGSIYVSAPRYVSNSEVEAFLEKKKDFIIKAISKTDERRANNVRPDRLDCGTTVTVAGKAYEVIIRSSRYNDVMLRDGYLFVYVRNIDDRDLATKVYNKWRCDQLRLKVLAICDEICTEFVKLGARAPAKIKFRTMKTRWGSCKPQEGVITFNYNLFEVPEECMRYVVIHEFAHLLVPDHSERFYRVVALIMPDWREKRRMLNEY